MPYQQAKDSVILLISRKKTFSTPAGENNHEWFWIDDMVVVPNGKKLDECKENEAWFNGVVIYSSNQTRCFCTYLTDESLAMVKYLIENGKIQETDIHLFYDKCGRDYIVKLGEIEETQHDRVVELKKAETLTHTDDSEHTVCLLQ